MHPRITGTVSSTIPAPTRRPTTSPSTSKRRNREPARRRADLRGSAHGEFPPFSQLSDTLARWLGLRETSTTFADKNGGKQDELDYNQRRHADLLQGLGHRTARRVQPRLAAECR